MELLLLIVVVACVAAFVAMPLVRGRLGAGTRTEDPRRAELEARKEAKYREIRDAELDHKQGKLSRADWARIDSELRREAIEILRALDELGPAKRGSAAAD